jgi:hypothetical protein
MVTFDCNCSCYGCLSALAWSALQGMSPVQKSAN